MKSISSNALTLIICLIITITGCKKESADEQYTVRGRVVVSCDDLSPVKNYEVYLYNDYKRITPNSCKAGELGRAITDENGNFEITYTSTCWKGELILRYDFDNFSYRNLVIDMSANKNYDLGNLYQENNGFYTYKVKTNTLYTNEDTLFYDIKYKSTPIIIDSTTWVFDSTYKMVTGPFINNMTIDYGQSAVPHIANPDSEYIGNQIITRWVLKNGNTIHAMERNQKGYIEPCKKFSKVVFDLSK